MELFKQLNSQQGTTLLVATHSAGVARVADRIVHIDDLRRRAVS
jgi:ABC-type lipoprotein export system ATPase subunit